MKTAVLISGQMRTFAKCYPTQKWQIFRHYEPDIHFFVSCVDDPQADSVKLLSADYENVNVERYQDPTDLPVIAAEKGYFAPYANATSHSKLMLQHWGNKKVWDFFCSKADASSFKTVIRIRPDLWIHRFEPVPELENAIGPYCLCPWWGKFGGINDRLAIMDIQAAHRYFNVYGAIPGLLKNGCPFHPETIVAEFLHLAGVNVQSRLMTEFSTERMDGSRRWAEIVMSDIAELIVIR
jgi:hypothetical protein